MARLVRRLDPCLAAALSLLLAMPAPGAEHVISVSNFVFSPRVLAIAPGDTVRWVNDGGGHHNVVADDGSFRCARGCDGLGGNGDAAPGPWSFSRTFAEPGLHPYFCEVHGTPGGSGMAGRIEVLEPGPCVPDAETLCLLEGRFRVRASWRAGGASSRARAVPLAAADSGLFYFVNPANIELLVKVLDACAPFDRFWVFAAATTNVELRLTVTDTASDRSRTYENRLGEPMRPVQDTDAFATCP